MNIEATSKEYYYSKHTMLIASKAGTWELLKKLLQTTLRKQTHSSRQPEVAVVTYSHTEGENGLGLNRPRHHYLIVKEVLYQQ